MSDNLMKVQVLSDLHLECSSYAPPETTADIIILAGDIAEGIDGIEWAKQAFDIPVMYVPGNHEFHNFYTMDQNRSRMRAAASGSNVILLDNGVAYVDGIRFIGTTMWSDLSRVGTVLYCDADSILVDHVSGESATYFNLADAQALFDNNRVWLQAELGKSFDGTTVVITHHAPSKKSIHENYNGNVWNDCFASDLESLMAGVDLWVHGHTHSSLDYFVGKTQVVCNPKGYFTEYGFENHEFNPIKISYIRKGI